MKNKMLWIGSVVILILSIVCFVVFGVGTELIRAVTGEGSGLSFGKYDGKDIVLVPRTDFANAIDNFTKSFRQQKSAEGQELDDSDYFYIYNYAFNATVQSMAFKNAVRKSSYKPSEKSVASETLPFLLNSEGKYDPRLYAQISETDKKSIRSEIETMLIWKRYNNDVFGGEKAFGDFIACLGDYQTAFYFDSTEKLGDTVFYGIKSSGNEAAFLASLGEEKRAFNAVAFDKSKYPEDEIRKFASENSGLFDSLQLSVITVKDEAQAKKLRAQITNNEITFEDGVSTYSEKYFSDGYGKIDQNFAYQIKDTLESEDDFIKIDSLKNDELSDVIKTSRAFSIFKCTGEKTKADFDDAAVLDAVKNYITANKPDIIESYFKNEADAFIAGAKADGFANAARKSGLDLFSIPAFPLNYGNISLLDKLDSSDARPFSGASSNEDFLTKAFSMREGEISEPLTLGNYIAVLNLTGIQNEKFGDEIGKELVAEAAGYDQSIALSVLLSSKKLENNVSDVYFNRILRR